ncbi:hypothetical protein [Aquaspirillum serpens]|uniref:hypothetical protein n=1 Tax=Aquaspirillum serpens TaxID=190 RepID=UPI0003B593F3|nr:hypothetical protein [Aquaspirillum serpens]
MNAIVFLLAKNTLVAWRLEPKKAPIRCKIQAEDCFQANSAAVLVEAYRDVLKRLADDGITLSHVHWLFNADSRSLWAAASPQLFTDTAPVMQGLSWEWLAERFALSAAPDLADVALIEARVFPWLLALEEDGEREQMQEALLKEHQSESERLEQERARLRRENEQLRTQNAAIEYIDTERLLSFLPALYSRVFTVLGPADLALLCGRIEPFDIPNPYPEPSEETLRTLQRRFRGLPQESQLQIVNFVQQLPQYQKLSLRPEMRSHIAELESI